MKRYSKGISSVLLIVFLGSLLVFGYFVYTGKINKNLFSRIIDPYCNVPIKIKLGNIDPRFKISNGTITKELEDASNVWEKEAGKDLFVFNGKNKSTVTVNFIYDERQQEAIKSSQALRDLKVGWNSYETQAQNLKTLASRYESLKAKYENDQAAYNQELNSYEARVRSWNQNKGSQSQYLALKAEGDNLDRSYATLESERRQLNNLADEVNNLNSKVQNLYNDLANKTNAYNKLFASDDQITVGEYDGNYDINIYQFTDLDQLRLTLAHELGHSLGMEHVSNELSVMYPLQVSQNGSSIKLTKEDIAEFNKVCGSKI